MQRLRSLAAPASPGLDGKPSPPFSGSRRDFFRDRRLSFCAECPFGVQACVTCVLTSNNRWIEAPPSSSGILKKYCMCWIGIDAKRKCRAQGDAIQGSSAQGRKKSPLSRLRRADCSIKIFWRGPGPLSASDVEADHVESCS